MNAQQRTPRWVLLTCFMEHEHLLTPKQTRRLEGTPCYWCANPIYVKDSPQWMAECMRDRITLARMRQAASRELTKFWREFGESATA